MNNPGNKKALIAALMAAMAGIPFQSIFAQEAGSGAENAELLEEVLVTASRRSVSLQDTGLSVTAWQPEDFAIGGLTTLEDVINYTPGVYYSGGASPSNNQITMRGVSNFTSAPSVGIYVDDIPIGSTNNNASGASLGRDLVQMDLERIEVIKGPQGTLYGSSSMGGIIRYITQDPSLNEFNGTLKSDWSFTQHGEFNQKYGAKISSPIISEKLGFSISGIYEDVGGFIDRAPQAVTGAAEDVNGYKSYGISTKLSANFSDQFSGDLLFMSNTMKWNGANIVPLQGPPFEPTYGDYVTDTSHSEDQNDFSLFGLTLNYDFQGASLVSSTSYQSTENASTTDLVKDFGALISLFSGQPTTEAPFTGATSTDKFVQEVRLVSSANEQMEWTIGAIYSDEDSGNLQRLEGLPANFLLLDVDIPSQLEELAGFGSLTWYFRPDFDVTVGARLAHVETTVAVDDGPEILITDTPPVTSSNNIDTYSFSARYRPADNVSWYARIASGYRPENANLPLRDVNGDNVAPLVVETDTLWSYELGVKGANVSNTFSYDLAAWYINWKDLQARIFVNGAMTGGNANSDVTSYGFEGTLNFVPAEDFTVITSFTYAHSTLDDDETSAFGAVAGENLPGVPKWTASVLANYDFTIGSNTEGFVGGGLRYIGDRDTGYEGGTGADGTPITPLISNFVLENYVVADAHVGFRTPSFIGTLYATNLFDEYAYSGGSARPAVGFIRATANVINPGTFGATLTYNF
ncbi:MAG TPA: TonB-dependent receptor [Xanthomonadales bacterium]|nr:TonB-dependent receptor [Xanthomonadales bacterium]